MKNTVVILGVNGDLGNALSERFVDDNRSLLIGLDLHETPKNKCLKHYIQCDISLAENITGTLNQLTSHLQKNLIVISCIGKFGQPSYQDNQFNEVDFISSVNTNLIGVSLFVNHLLSLMLEKPDQKTRVVIVGSAASQVGSLDMGYGVAKAGLNGLVRSISKSLSKNGVTCIGVNPGIFESRMSQSVSKERQQKAMDDTHIKRMGALDEVTDFVYYLSHDAPDYLTGSIIPISGGQI